MSTMGPPSEDDSMKQLQDRVAVVTGASKGIGRAIAEAFAAEGAKVVIASRTASDLAAVAEAIRKNGGTALAQATDVSVEADVINLFKAATDRYGRHDILVNNAGISLKTPTDQIPLEAC